MYGVTLFVCVIAAFAFVNVEGRAASSDVPKDGKCEKGKLYKVDCNTCVCGDNGVLACTLALCLNKRSASDDELKEPCKNGEIKNIGNGCNYCTCRDQKWRCIDGDIAKCVENQQKRKRAAECVEGQSKNIDCNSCHCTNNGNWACTRRACLSSEEVAALHGNRPSSSDGHGGIYRV